MKFSIDRNAFSRVLKRICGVCTNKSSIQILASCLIEAKDKSITITGTDLDIIIRVVEDAIVAEEGRAVVNAKRLLDTVQNQAVGDVTIETDGGKVCVRSGNFTARIGKDDESEYPDLSFADVKGAIMMDAIELKGLINKTLFCISKDDSRPDFTGAFMSIDNGGLVQMVSTDGHRLALAKANAHVDGDVPSELKHGIIIPRKGLMELAKSLIEGDALIDMSGGRFVVVSGANTFQIKLIAGQFPNFSNVIPMSFKHECVVKRESLIGLLKRAAIFSPKTGLVVMSISRNMLEISTSDTQAGEMHDHIDADHDVSDSIKVGFNYEYIVEALSVIDDDDVLVRLIDEDSPAVLRASCDDGCDFVIMPMQI